MKTNFERGQRMRNYSWKNNLVQDFNTSLKFSLLKFWDINSGMEILDEIHTKFLNVKLAERNCALYRKYSKEISEADVKNILHQY